MKKLFLILLLAAASGVSFAQTSIQGRETDVRAWGAKCDASTNDTSAIQAAITAMATAGGVVNLPDGTCIVTGLSVPGGVTLRGKGKYVTTIKSSTNAVILNLVQGSGTFAFFGPKVTDLAVDGSDSGSSQIGIQITDALYMRDVVIEEVFVSDAGSHGLSFGNVFSSSFKNINSSSNGGYPFFYDSPNMPSNYFYGLYAGDISAAAPAGYRIKQGTFTCWSCNGVNTVPATSYWAVIGGKNGDIDGDVEPFYANARFVDCNIEGTTTGVLNYPGSVPSFEGMTSFVGLGSASGSYKAIDYDTDASLVPEVSQRGYIADTVTFSNSPITFYANSQPIHADGNPPVSLNGQGLRVAGVGIISTYRNSASARAEQLNRADGYMGVVSVSATTSFTNPGLRYLEVTCASNCTQSLPAPSFYNNAELVVIKNLSATGIVVTINGNSGSTVNGSSLTLSISGQVVGLLPNATAYDWRVASNSLPSNTAANQVQAYNVKVDGGCTANGVANDTSCVSAAYTAAIAAGRPLYFPTGTYLVDGGTLTIATNSVTIFGDGPGRSTLKNRTAGAAITLNNTSAITHSITIRDISLSGFGSGSSDIGISVTGAANEPFGLLVESVTIGNVAGKGISVTNNLFTSRFVDVDVSVLTAGTNGIDISGGADIVLENCYVHSVGTGGAAYRIHAGTITMIGCNGIDSGTTADWLVLGDSTGTGDPSDRYARAILIGANVEAFTNRGIYAKAGSYVSEYRGVSFLAPASGTVTPIKYDFVDTAQRGTWDSASSFSTLGASYTNGNAINSNGAPFVQIGDTTLTSYYDTGASATVSLPSLSVQLVPGSTNTSIKITRAQLTALESSGLVGDLTGSNSFAGDAARVLLQDGTAARPTYSFSGDTNTGLYRAGADSIGLAANGAVVGSVGATGLTLGAVSSVTGALNLANASSSFLTTITAGNAAASRTYVWPTNFGAAGTVLTDAAGNGVLSWAIPTVAASLTATRVGYGDGSNLLTGTTDFIYATSTKTLSVINGSGNATLVLNGSSEGSKVQFNTGAVPGTQGGIVMPFSGGTHNSGPGIWWSDASNTSGLRLTNGLVWQGENSTHDPFKIAEGTGTTTDGTIRYTFAPSSSLFTQNLSTGVTTSTHDAMALDLISSGGAGGTNFGAGWLVRLENASSSLANATRLSFNWTTATAGAETSRFVVANNTAGGGLGDSFTVQGDQYFGSVNALGNKSGSFTIDFNDGNFATATATGNWTTVTFSNIKGGGTYVIRITQDATGGRTWTPPTNLKYAGGGGTNILTGTANAVDLVYCFATDSTNLWCNILNDLKNP